DVLEPRLADPSDARLQRFQRGEEQMPAFARLASGMGDVRVVQVTALATVPGRCGRAKQRIDRGTLVVGRDGVPQPQIHQSSPAAASGSARWEERRDFTRTGSTRTAHALNSAVPDFGSVALIVSRFVMTSSGKWSVMKTTPARRPRSMYTGASSVPRR